MKELFQGKIEIIELFKKYYTEVRKKEVENSTELLKELDRKAKMLNSRLKIASNEKEEIYRKLEKIQDIKNGKVGIVKCKPLYYQIFTDNSVMHIFSEYFTESEGIQLFYIRFGSYNHSAFVALNIDYCSYKKENFQCLLL